MSTQANVSVPKKAAQVKQKTETIKVEVPEEQLKYANMLLYCSWAGIGMLVITFLIYVSGIMNPLIPPQQMPQYWGLNSHDYLVQTGSPYGWGWLSMVGHGDFINLVGIAFLALLTIIGYVFLLLPAYLRKKDFAYASIVVVEILVLVLAASGILAVGAH